MRKSQAIAALSALCLLASCDDVVPPALAPPGAEWPATPQLAMEAALAVLRTDSLRPAVRALGSRSYEERSLDAVLEQVAQAAALLSPEQPEDDERRRAAAIALEFAVLSNDAIAADVQAAERGLRSVTRRNANNVVQRANQVRIAMASNWRWPIEHQEEVALSIDKARTSRDEIFRWAPWAPVMNAGVTAANVSQLGVSLGKLMLAGPAALERVMAWFKGPGSGGGVQWALAGEGGAVAVSLVGRSGALVLTEAELVALAQAGQVSGLALQMLYLARGQLHHIATDKNWISDSSGGPWSPVFEEYFEGAGLELNDPANLVEVEGHVGPHPRAYHEEVLRTQARRPVRSHTGRQWSGRCAISGSGSGCRVRASTNS